MMSRWWFWQLSLFFFFKQKTAYEMRISDWSSDVCSSDLKSRNMSPGECSHRCIPQSSSKRATAHATGAEHLPLAAWPQRTVRIGIARAKAGVGAVAPPPVPPSLRRGKRLLRRLSDEIGRAHV